MKYDINIIQSLIDSMAEGALVLDKENTVLCSNLRAREIIGYSLSNEYPHPSGRIEDGDIVIIADSRLGDDDGKLEGKDLTCLGLDDPDISQENTILLIAAYHNDSIKPVYKFFGTDSVSSKVSLDCKLFGMDLSCMIDPLDSYARISVNDLEFTMTYFRSVGHMVIIDPITRDIKFYQDKGYTIRKETVSDILKGKNFSSKGEDLSLADISGMKINDIIEEESIIRAIEDGNPVVNSFLEINKRMMILSIYPVYDKNEPAGTLFKFEDASDLNDLINQRNEIISRVERLQSKRVGLSDSGNEDPFPLFYGNSAAMKRVKFLAKRAMNSKANVLITGDSGTGKSRLAYEIHNAAHPDLPFVEVNCSSIPQALFESEFFGYVGGAFTGALKSGKPGYFETANGGTLFLDEIGEIPIEVQVKLLQALQTKRIYRVGSAVPIDVDIRIIAATNIDISKAVARGEFRQDLYYRLNVFPITIPPLKDHPNDIYIISNNILREICNREGIAQKKLSASSVEKIMNYSWPGNIRELENIIERAVMLCDGTMIFPEYIDIDPDMSEKPMETETQTEDTVLPMKETMEKAKIGALRKALEISGGDSNEAMRLLKLPKTTFYSYMKKYGL